jgi:hypothetical protein
MSKLNKIKEMLQSMLMQFSQLSTDKGLISWVGDEELPAVGDSIVIVDEEGNEVKAESGEYRADNGKVIIIEDGNVIEIREEEKPVEEPQEEPKPEEEPAEEPSEEPQEEPVAEPEPENEPEPQEEPAEPEVDERDARIAELEARVAELEAENDELRARIKELEEKPAGEPASEEFERINKIEKPKDKKLGRLYDIVNAKEQ